MLVDVRWARAAALLALGLWAGGVWGGVVIKEGDTWRYFKGTSTPSNNWNQAGFGDGPWLSGASGIGYGDSDDATTISDMQNAYASIYVRRTFSIASTAAVKRLTLAVDFDDGFVAYVNGQEVARRNVSGTPSHNTLATAGHGSSRDADATDSNEKEFFTIDPGLLTEGAGNVLALSGHNSSLGSTDFTLIPELYTNVTLVRGPFIQMPDTNGVLVCWRTDALTDSVVDYGFDTNYLSGTVSNGAAVREHAVALTGLAPGTSYYYRVRSDGVVLAEGEALRTRAATNQPFRFVVLGDFGAGTPGMYAIANRINATNFDFMVTVGDNLYNNGEPGYYDPRWFGLYATSMARAATFPALGNHDTYLSNARWMATNFYLPTNGPAARIEQVYSFDFGNAHVAVIDTEPFEANDAAVKAAIKTWLSNDLATTTQPWKFVTLHRPPYTTQGSHNDQAAVKAEVCPILEKYGVQMVFQGHNHFYERINPINGVYYLTSGGGGAGLYTAGARKEYSATLFDSLHSYAVVTVDGSELSLRAYDVNGSQIDSFTVGIGQPFQMDGLLDSNAWVRASNTLNTIRLSAAIRGNHLYVAGQDAPPPANGNNDHFIFVNTNLTGNFVSAPWEKAGSNLQWSAFLGDESVNGFVGWFGPGQQMLTDPQTYRAMSSGLFENGTNQNGALEGMLHLPGHFGSFPPELCLAFAPYQTTNKGLVLWEYQIPPATAGDHINSNEWLRIPTRALALDLPSAEAGTNATAEAGLWVGLNGSQSTAPSGLPLSYLWSQLTGPSGEFNGTTAATTAFRLTNNVPASTSLVVQLAVNDTRFDSNDVVQLTFTPMADADLDGLSDQEELTGADNVLTLAHPQGATSLPNDPDSDDDGVNDGLEALAGTDRNDAQSLFEISEAANASASNLLVRWSSVAGRMYTIQSSTNLVSGLVPLQSNIPASYPLNTFTIQVDDVSHLFYVIEVQP
jgi:hypothetical protein